MNVLHILSQFEVTGAEVYAATLAREQIRRGHRVFFVSDTLSTPVDAPFFPLPIGVRSYPQRLKNVAEVIKLVHALDIHVIHAHSRAASWVSFFASRRTGIPFVSSVHGRQHLHFSSRTFNVYGRNVIAVAESLKQHLIEDLGLRANEVVVIPNGFELATAAKSTKSDKKGLFGVTSKVVLFVGRLSGPKGDVVRFLVSEVLPEVERKTRCVLYIIGGLKVPEDIPRMIETANRQLGRQAVILKEFQKDVSPYLRAADLVVGSGRVAVESLILGRPTIAFGESGYEGLITPGNFAERMKTNFGDTGIPRPVNKSEVTHDIAALLKARPSSPRTLRAAAQSHFDVAVVEPRVREVYYRSRARMNSASRIPVLMYHRVVDRPLVESKHGIWVTAVRFRKQLNSLRIRGFSPITFVDYKRFLDGEARLPANPIILTFDDGYQDNYELAFPALQDFGFKAVVYLVADAERRTNFWDPDEPSAPLLSNGQIREMASSGIEFGSHTVTHPRLPEISERQIRQELKDSKSAIEQIVGSEVLSLAYPYGAVNPFVRLIAAEEGYTFAAAGNTGPVRFSEDFLEIRRTQVFPWTGSLGFWKKTQPWYLRYKTL